jgi:hypothetical protein
MSANNLRSLTSEEIEILFDCAKFQFDYAKSVIKIENNLSKIRASKYFESFMEDDYLTYDSEDIGEFLHDIVEIIYGKIAKGFSIFFVSNYDKNFEKVENVVAEYFKTQNIRTISLNKIAEIIHSQMYENVSIAHFNLLKIKNDIDKLLLKMEQDARLLSYITDFKNDSSNTNLYNYSFIYETDMESIFGGILDETDTYYIIKKFYNLE